MNKDSLIAKQQLKLEEFEEILSNNTEIVSELNSMFYNIGAPLNDNKLKFNNEQLKWCFEVISLINELNINQDEEF